MTRSKRKHSMLVLAAACWAAAATSPVSAVGLTTVDLAAFSGLEANVMPSPRPKKQSAPCPGPNCPIPASGPTGANHDSR